MELPKSKKEFLLFGAKFLLGLPFLYLSYRINRPINVRPFSATIALTEKCNFRCIMCLGNAQEYDPLPDMDLPTVKRVIDDMKGMGIPYLTLPGGEPFLVYDSVLETVKYAQQRGILVGMVSNGWLLNEEKLAQLFAAGLHRIALSLDGATPATHDLIRREGSYERIIASLELIQRLKKEKSFPVRVHLNTVVQRLNFRELLPIAHIARRFGAYSFFQPVGTSYNELWQNSTPSAETESIKRCLISGPELKELQAEVDKLIRFKNRYGTIANLTWQLKNIVNYYRSFEVGKNLVNSKCYSGFHSIFIRSNGDFGSCEMFPAVGNVHHQSIRDAWASPEYNKMRKTMSRCSCPCLFNCHYPINPAGLFYDFLLVPAFRTMRSYVSRSAETGTVTTTSFQREPHKQKDIP